MADATVAEVDPVTEAAKRFAAPLPVASPPVESPVEPVVPAAAKETESVGEVVEPVETPAKETTETSEAEDDPDGSKALRAAIQKDPALGLVPEIRARVGLPPLGEGNGHGKDPVVIPLSQTDEEFAKSYRGTYEEKMKAGDDLGAIEAVANATASRAIEVAVDRSVKRVLSLARDNGIVDQFFDAHPDSKEKRIDVFAKVQSLRRNANVDRLSDAQVIGLIGPGKIASKPATDAAAKAILDAAARKAASKSSAASAAGSPTNQRSAGAPAPVRPQTASEKALASILADPKDDRASRALYDPKALVRR